MKNVLPKYFPNSFTTSPDYRKVLRFYQQFTEDYYSEYGFGHFIMAAYAAVPALLTPDLMYKIWLNFNQYHWKKRTVNIHRMAVSDVLLSEMCREVGYELYEMLPAIRDAFLEWLQKSAESQQWKSRGLQTPQQIAAFVQAYHQRQNAGTLRWGKGYEEVQEWNTLLFLNPKAAQRKLLEKLRQSTSTNNNDAVRVMDFWAKAQKRVEITAEHPLAVKNFTDNAIFAGALKALLQKNSDTFLQQLQDFPQLSQYLTDEAEGGIPVEVASDLEREIQSIAPPTFVNVLIGINNYPQAQLSKLQGCINDVQQLSDFLAQYVTTQKWITEMRVFIDEEATLISLQSIFERVQELRNGDTFLLYFAGHSEYQNTNKQEGKELIFFDSEQEQLPLRKGKFSRPQPTHQWTNTLTQYALEEFLYTIVKDKAIHVLLIFDTHTADLDSRKKLNNSSLRKNASQIKGSVVVLNAGQAGEAVVELNLNNKQQGAFSYSLEEILSNGGSTQNYQQILEQVLNKMSNRGIQHTPLLECFPSFARYQQFLQQRTASETFFDVFYHDLTYKWLVSAGEDQGLTPSLDFMPTILELDDGTNAVVTEVRSQDAIVEIHTPYDYDKTFKARLLQKAFAKIKIAFHSQMDERMQEQVLAITRLDKLFYAEIVEDITSARFIIQNLDTQYILTDNPSAVSHPTQVLMPESNVYEFVKKINYVAKFTGILDYQNPRSTLPKNLLEIEVNKIEGDPLMQKYLDGVPSTETVVNRGEKPVELRYVWDEMNSIWNTPALRLNLSLQYTQPLFATVLLLDDRYGIIDCGSYELSPSSPTRAIAPNNTTAVHFPYDTNTMRTYQLHTDATFRALERDEIYLYFKIFLSNKPLNINALTQNNIILSGSTPELTESDEIREDAFRLPKEVRWQVVTLAVKVIHPEYRQMEDVGMENVAQVGDVVDTAQNIKQSNIQQQGVDDFGVDVTNNIPNEDDNLVTSDFEKFKKKLYDLLANDDLNSLFEQLSDFIKTSSPQKLLVHGRKNNYDKIQRQIAQGTLSPPRAKQQIEKIKEVLFKVIEELTEEDLRSGFSE